MGIGFEIRYNPLVQKQDIPLLGEMAKRRIQRAIMTRLMTMPVEYSLPLKNSLKGHRKLRVGDYRVVFLIQRQVVYVEAILHRSMVYKEVLKRIISS
jgi:mRNA-degrading endonuclease RelE of RelBE toxin-antitoxin system